MIESYSIMFGLIADVARLTDETPCCWETTYDTLLKQVIEAQDVDLSHSQLQKLTRIEHMLFDYIAAFSTHANKPSKKVIVESIFARHQVEQRTQQWYDDMKIMLTASEFATLYKSPRTIGQLALSKINPEKRESQKAKHSLLMLPTDWGVRFEPVVRSYLENLWKCTIYECGRLRHLTNTMIGASPDGIIINTDSEKYGRLVEIKCPFSRSIGKGVPRDYWIQMQIQMEVTNLEECEYVEVEILSKKPLKKEEENTKEQGCIKEQGELYLLENNDKLVYAYTSEERDTLLKDSHTLVETIDYTIVNVCNVLVQRDREWYKTTESLQTEFWKIVEKAENGSYILPNARAVKPKACLISEEK